jgi:hypothetical protein
MTNQDEVGDEMLMSLADGELQGAEAAVLMRRVRTDPALAARYAVFVETRALLRDTYAGQPVPDRLIRAVTDTPMGMSRSEGGKVVPLRWHMASSVSAPGLALAASLLLAVGIAGFLAGRGTAPVQVTGEPVAMAAEALAGSATGDSVLLPDGQGAQVLASFETDVGLCRLIALESIRAVACRGDDGWATALTVSDGDGATFLPASNTATVVVDRLLDQIGAGSPLDVAAERAALTR